MTSAPGRGSRPIRIGNCSGFYGDRRSTSSRTPPARSSTASTGPSRRGWAYDVYDIT
jgi:hypothetical protein